MKKIFSFIFIIALCVSMEGCGFYGFPQQRGYYRQGYYQQQYRGGYNHCPAPGTRGYRPSPYVIF